MYHNAIVLLLVILKPEICEATPRALKNKLIDIYIDIYFLFSECKCSKMDYYLQQHLVKKLDIEKRSQANWYDVGIKFKIPKDDLESFRLEYKKDGGSPTNCLLETLETRGEDEPTVKDFVTVLQGLGRNDIICSWDWVNNQKKN